MNVSTMQAKLPQVITAVVFSAFHDVKLLIMLIWSFCNPEYMNMNTTPRIMNAIAYFLNFLSLNIFFSPLLK